MNTKFLLKKIIEILDEVYLHTEYIEGNQNFKLSNYSTLNNIGIINFLEIPRSIDNFGNLVLNNYIFKLKNKIDKNLLEENTFLILKNSCVFVEASFNLSKIGIIAFLECFDEELKKGTQLIDFETNEIWIVDKKIFTTGSIESYKLREQRESKNIYEYLLISNTNNKPPEKQYLKILNQ